MMTEPVDDQYATQQRDEGSSADQVVTQTSEGMQSAGTGNEPPKHRWTPDQRARIDAALDIYLYYLVRRYVPEELAEAIESECEHRSVYVLLRRARQQALAQVSHRRLSTKDST